MVEEARLESVYTPKGYRGFESRFLRKQLNSKTNRRFVAEKLKGTEQARLILSL